VRAHTVGGGGGGLAFRWHTRACDCAALLRAMQYAMEWHARWEWSGVSVCEPAGGPGVVFGLFRKSGPHPHCPTPRFPGQALSPFDIQLAPCSLVTHGSRAATNSPTTNTARAKRPRIRQPGVAVRCTCRVRLTSELDAAGGASVGPSCQCLQPVFEARRSRGFGCPRKF
jgi:hypothetical protein